MNAPRNWYRYDFKVGNKIRHSGITRDPDQREKQHQERWPSGHLSVQGPAVTKDAALNGKRVSTKLLRLIQTGKNRALYAQ